MEKLIIQNMGSNLGDFFFIELEKNGASCVIMVDGHTVKNGYTKSAKSQIGKYERIDYLISLNRTVLFLRWQDIR
jgi:hypothetical protein